MMDFIKKAKGIGEILMAVTYAAVGLFAKDDNVHEDSNSQAEGQIKCAVDKNIQKEVVVKGKKDRDGSIASLEICLAAKCKNIKICLADDGSQSEVGTTVK